jgi:hypothetical protein
MSGTVSGHDAHRRIEGKAAAVFLLRHRLRGIARQQAAAHENAQQPLAHGLLHPRDGGGIDTGCGMEDHTVGRSGLEHAVDDDAVKTEVGIERGAEAVDEGERAEAGRGTRTSAVRAQALLYRAQEQPQGGTLERGLAFQDVAQPLRHREDSLPHGQAWHDVIGEMRRPPPYDG